MVLGWLEKKGSQSVKGMMVVMSSGMSERSGPCGSCSLVAGWRKKEVSQSKV